MKVKIVKKIIRPISPYKNKITLAAHKKANAAEKKKYPKGYEKFKKFDDKLGRHEFAGENFYSGKIEVSEKVPKSLIKEAIFHETVEQKQKSNLKKLNKEKLLKRKSVKDKRR